MFLLYIIVSILLVSLLYLVCSNEKNNKKHNNTESTTNSETTTNITIYTMIKNTTTVPIAHKRIVNSKVENILTNYPDFSDVLINASLELPLNNGFIPQGITYYNDLLLVVGYYENGKNSESYILDLEGNIVNKVELDTNSHVGAIVYDSNNELFWIPDNNGILNAYDVNEFINNDFVKFLYKFDYISDGLNDYIYYNKKNIAFISIDNNYIYIGNFYKTKKSLVKKYLIKNEDNIKLEFINQFLVPPRTQGIEFVNYKNDKYMLFSNSFNRRTTSYLEVYKYDERISDYSNKYIKRISMPPMSEQVVVNNQYAFIIFESGANKYYNALNKINYICVLDINKIFN